MLGRWEEGALSLCVALGLHGSCFFSDFFDFAKALDCVPVDVFFVQANTLRLPGAAVARAASAGKTKKRLLYGVHIQWLISFIM